MTVKAEQWEWDELQQSRVKGYTLKLTQKADFNCVFISWK